VHRLSGCYYSIIIIILVLLLYCLYYIICISLFQTLLQSQHLLYLKQTVARG